MSHQSLFRHIYHAVVVANIFWATGLAVAAEVKNGFDITDALVSSREILWGGVSRDGIPSINKPKFVDVHGAKFLRDRDRVLGVYRNGIAKAYPIRILDRHEVVNDRFGDEPITVTYCPLCFSGMSFMSQARDAPLTFGVSGLLYNSDVLLYDHQTESLWSQIRSQAISGPLQGASITPIPTAHTTWRDWRDRHPDTLVLSTDTGFRISYANSPYRDYQRTGQLMFPVSNRDGRYRNKELVLGVRIDGTQKAYPFEELRKHDRTSFSDAIGDEKVTIEWFEDDMYARILDSRGKEIPSVIVYWFAWYAFHPETDVFQAGSG